MSKTGSPEARRRALRFAYNAQGGVCPYCRQPMIDPDYARERGLMGAPTSPTREHILPRAYGGTNARENIIAVHKYCNERRDRRRIPECAKPLIHTVRQAVQAFREAQQ